MLCGLVVVLTAVFSPLSKAFDCDDGCFVIDDWVNDNYCDCSNCEDEYSTGWTCSTCPGCPTVCGDYEQCYGTSATTVPPDVNTTLSPTNYPTTPTISPSGMPTSPTLLPTLPTSYPSDNPTGTTMNPSQFPTLNPTMPTLSPTTPYPSLSPTSDTDIKSINWIEWNASTPSPFSSVMGMGIYNDKLFIIQAGGPTIYSTNISSLLTFNSEEAIVWDSYSWSDSDSTSWRSSECYQCFTVSDIYNSIYIVNYDHTWSSDPNTMFIFNMELNQVITTNTYNSQLLTESYVDTCMCLSFAFFFLLLCLFFSVLFCFVLHSYFFCLVLASFKCFRLFWYFD